MSENCEHTSLKSSGVCDDCGAIPFAKEEEMKRLATKIVTDEKPKKKWWHLW